ncbi:ATP-binding cassette, subfamily B [Lentzea albidocapillata subsp. violacea]|uniref:ATP-binding cassette, subfamily B n=1 Tax=Lentzea albidocapillata subsp. violacea TaxID=128104 RepID=A0A1G9XTD4_9PSEU|nr:ABC transporter ATP-binding protein [Lentzea albidocapillata]SDN00057.1 ATP-binding cassette, subfamily B [Lentzea albidocapillata subsp. violacea]
MKERFDLWRLLIALNWRADRNSVLIIAALVPLDAVGIALTALGQRHLIDAAGLGVVTGVIAAAALGAGGYLITNGINRSTANLQNSLVERVDVLVNDEVSRAVNGVPTLAHLEHPDYLDRVSTLSRGARSLAFACWSLVGTATALVQVVLSLWLLFDVHPALPALALFALPPLWTATWSGTPIRRARAANAEGLRLEARLHGLVVDPRTAGELRISESLPHVDALAAQTWDRARRTMFRARLAAAGWQFGGWAVYAVGYLGALLLCMHFVATGRATLGDLVLLLTLTGQLRGQVGAVVAEVSSIHDARQNISHLAWLRRHGAAQEQPGTRPALDRLAHGIDLTDVEFRYEGSGQTVLSGMNLTLAAGTTVALVGANGAGKTTLVKLLTGLYRPTGGTIAVDGHDLTEIDGEHWRGRCTAVFQDFAEFHVRAHDAVGIGDLDRINDTDVVQAAIIRAGALPVVEALPDGLETKLGPPNGSGLSRGQWQKIALARGAMRPHAVLTVLDEPTAALDPQAEHEVHQRFSEEVAVGDGRIVLLVSHRFSTVRMADRIVVLDGGRITEQGTHQELIDLQGTYARLYRMQADGYQLSGEPR